MLTRRLLILLALFMPVALAVPAYADDLASAKAAGQVGERPDGMLGIVGASTPALEALVKDVNSRRLDVFKGIATKNGQSLAAVQAVSGEEFIKRTPAGQYIMDAAGKWVKK